MLQITGRSNYEAIQKRIDKFASDENVNIFKKYDSPNKAISIDEGYMTVTEATLTGMADWYKDDMYAQADKTGTKPDNDVVDLIVDIINKHTSSRLLRQEHYQKTKVTFIVHNCRNINKETPKNKSNGKWHNPLKKMELRGWYSETQWSPEKSDYKGRTGGKHDGLDLYAPIGTQTFACVDSIVIDDYTSDTYGKTLTLKGEYNNQTYYFFYSHLSERVVSKSNNLIKAGTVIGKTGQTGNASGQLSKMNHLHFEVRNTSNRTGGRLDPYTIIELKSINKNPKKENQV